MRLLSEQEQRYFESLGVDWTLLWENLQRSSTELVERHQEMLALVTEVQGKLKPNDSIQKTDC